MQHEWSSKTEIWKPIKNYEGLYEVSNLGTVRSLDRKASNHTSIITKKGKILKKRENKKGYLSVVLYKSNIKKDFKIHRLVAQAFIPNLDNKIQVNHINGIKKDNEVDNLEWCTNAENQVHAWETGLQKRKMSSEVHNSRSILQFDLEGNFIKKYECIMDAVRELKKKSSSHIVQCCKGERKKAYNHIWVYEEV